MAEESNKKVADLLEQLRAAGADIRSATEGTPSGTEGTPSGTGSALADNAIESIRSGTAEHWDAWIAWNKSF